MGITAAGSLHGVEHPKAELIPSDHHDFGQVSPGARLFHSFELRNGGGSPLEIKGMKASCGCTRAHATKSIVAPGESAHIEVELSATRLDQRVNQDVVLQTNDPERELIRLQLTAVVDSPIKLTSSSFDFGMHSSGKTTSVVRKGEGPAYGC
ncbi:MAG: DUF1573 domain-containing protein [Candidatus Competibacteraceae bacterium]|nr:DUF1573 domain-containing protein [Candidatus Competibacteraceae bacterium]